MICGKRLRDVISIQTIRDMTCVEKIEEFMREQRLRWFGHVERMDIERTPVNAKNFVVDGSEKGIPTKRWKEVVEKAMLVTGLRRTDAQDRYLWRLGCKNWLNHALRENNPGSRRMKIYINTPGINGR